LLRAIDRELGLSWALAAVVEDRRESGKVRHDLLELFRERIFSIACGYPDGADADRLADDPRLKWACGLSPSGEAVLASQPTLSRFENSIRRVDLMRLSYALTSVVLESQRDRLRGQPPKRITIDLDSTDDPTHGQQEFTFFRTF